MTMPPATSEAWWARRWTLLRPMSPAAVYKKALPRLSPGLDSTAAAVIAAVLAGGIGYLLAGPAAGRRQRLEIGELEAKHQQRLLDVDPNMQPGHYLLSQVAAIRSRKPSNATWS